MRTLKDSVADLGVWVCVALLIYGAMWLGQMVPTILEGMGY